MTRVRINFFDTLTAAGATLVLPLALFCLQSSLIDEARAQEFSASTLAVQAGDTSLAKSTQDSMEAMSSKGNNPNTRNNADIEAWYASGVDQLEKGNADDAVITLEKVVKQAPNHVPGLVNLARAYVDLERLDEADKTVDRAIALDSTNAEAFLVRGRVFFSKGNSEDAISAYQRSIDLDKDNPYAYNNLALIYIQDGRFQEAIPLLEKAVEQKSSVPFFYNNLGIAYEGNGNTEKAVEAFQSALTMKPDYAKAHENLKRVEEQEQGLSQMSGNAGRRVPAPESGKDPAAEVRQDTSRPDTSNRKK